MKYRVDLLDENGRVLNYPCYISSFTHADEIDGVLFNRDDIRFPGYSGEELTVAGVRVGDISGNLDKKITIGGGFTIWPQFKKGSLKWTPVQN